MMLAASHSVPALTDSEFHAIARIVRLDSGIALNDGKRALVTSRLGRRLRALGLHNYAAYCALLEGDEGRDERNELISAITTNVTTFFREGHHFEALSRTILPPLVAAARQGRRVRLWSAGCSSGEEPCSIAMTILELMPDASQHDILILATDIDTRILERAREGIYDDEPVRGVSIPRRSRFLSRTPAGWQVSSDVQALIFFEPLNLHGHWPFRGPFDVIFCRNVTIYFDADDQRRLWDRFVDVLAPDGRLFIGHSERVDGPAASRIGLVGTTQYARTRSQGHP